MASKQNLNLAWFNLMDRQTDRQAGRQTDRQTLRNMSPCKQLQIWL